MDTDYVYTKLRRDFGRHCFFADSGPHTLSEVLPDIHKVKGAVQKLEVDKEVQCVPIMAQHTVNTKVYTTENFGINHTEGGWPRDVNPLDEEQVSRFRKKIEKDTHFQSVLSRLGTQMEHCIKQNNAVNIYDDYFLTEEEEEVKTETRIINTIKDFHHSKQPVSDLAWCREDETKLAASYSYLKFQTPAKFSRESYIWDLNNVAHPISTLQFDSSLVCLEYSLKTAGCIIAGSLSGQIAYWDLRKGGTVPVEISPSELSHREPVFGVHWIHSKSGMECFSASTDGQVIWWDLRKPNEAVEVLILDTRSRKEIGNNPSIQLALGARTLEYDVSIPSKFMVGTVMGSILQCVKKARDKVQSIYSRHFGPIRNIHRNYFQPKCFLSVDSQEIKIWADECKDASILTLKGDEHAFKYAVWSPTCPSVLFAAKENGYIEAWDVLLQRNKPASRMKVTDEGLTILRINETSQLVATGTSVGNIVLLEISDSFRVPRKNDKTHMLNTLERETRREKILEARVREAKMKGKLAADELKLEMERELRDEPTKEQIAEEYALIVDKEYAKLDAEYMKELKLRKEEAERV